MISLRKESQLFLTSKCDGCNNLIFDWPSKTRNDSNQEKKENLDNCSWPSGIGILQSSTTKAASLEEWVHDKCIWIRCKAVLRIVGKYFFRKCVSLKYAFDLKSKESLDIERNKRILNVLENSFKKLSTRKIFMANVWKKSGSFFKA